METKTVYNAALYCRLSREDGNNGNAESNSIQGQQDMLTSYAAEHGYNVYDCYVEMITPSLIQLRFKDMYEIPLI
jgi:DNA invertase Pin-like site-specific DNA recombinase